MSKKTEYNGNIQLSGSAWDDTRSPSAILWDPSLYRCFDWIYQVNCLLTLSYLIGAFKMIVSFYSIYSRTPWELILPPSNPNGLSKLIVNYSLISSRTSFQFNQFNCKIWAIPLANPSWFSNLPWLGRDLICWFSNILWSGRELLPFWVIILYHSGSIV